VPEEPGVRINIPLVPILVEVRWRPLQPFRFSLRGLMIMVGVAALFFSLCAYLGQLNRAANYHAEQAFKASFDRTKSRPYGPTPLEDWHWKMVDEYRAIFYPVEFIVFLLVVTFVSLVIVAILGRVLHWWHRRSVAPPE
jgi:hypothetical protein